MRLNHGNSIRSVFERLPRPGQQPVERARMGRDVESAHQIVRILDVDARRSELQPVVVGDRVGREPDFALRGEAGPPDRGAWP